MPTHRDIDDLNSLIAVHKKNLARLKLQKAKFGTLNVPSPILNQIDDEEDAIREIERRIEESENIYGVH
ncbi:MAG: hypothetical protein QME42_02070 [bacterium]|nr:hypothetical protein [bacterium]